MTDENDLDILLTDEDFKHDMSETFTSIRIFYCKNNECNISTGYIKYVDNNEEDNVRIAKCNYDYCEKVIKSIGCNSNASVYYDEGLLYFCFNNGKTTNNKKLVEENKINYLFDIITSNSRYYNLYMTNEIGNVIALSTSGKLEIKYIYIYMF